MTLKRQKGFTLIELLIVITIIGILAVALVPRLTGGQARARDAQRKADLQQIATALEFYNDDNAGYPDTPTTNPRCLSDLETELGAYLSSVPDDPKGSAASVWASDCDKTDGGYTYINLGSGYLLMAGLENTSDKGQNVYDGDTFSYGSYTSISDVYSDSGNITALCETTDCTDGTSGSDAAIYVIGR